MGVDDNTNQKVASISAAMFPTSGLSRHSQIITSSEISGSDAIKAPKPEWRFAIYDISAMMTPEIAAWMSK